MQKTSLVTGGLQGIGRAIVDTLRARGDRVFVFDRLDPSHALVRDLEVLSVVYIHVDISSIESIKAGFTALFSHISTLDVCVNNAGVTKDNVALRMSESEWDTVLNVNLKGAFFCAQEALKRMVKSISPSYIIMMSSVVGRLGNPGQANYAASKAGLEALTKTLAAEYGKRNVLVNAVAPGFIDTAMTQKLPEAIRQKVLEHIPLQRLGTVEDVAHVVAFLTSGNADYITGQIIDVSGGL